MSPTDVIFDRITSVGDTAALKSLYEIAAAEESIMKVLWESSPPTAARIVESVGDQNDWSPKTVHTLMNVWLFKVAHQCH